MDADTITTESNVTYVKDITVYITGHYADDLYDSCANVQFAGGGAGVMSLLCGPTPKCNASAFLKFQGDPSANGESPFLIKYNITNDTTPYKNNLRHLNDTGIRRFYHCNENVTGKGVCSCSDCPSTCPPPPKFTVKHLPFKVIAWSIGGTGCFISTIIFIAALSSSVYFGFFRKRSGYKRISSDRSPPPKQGYGATGRGYDERESSTSSSLNSDREEDEVGEGGGGGGGVAGCCCQVGHNVERSIKLVFYHWGRFVAKFWYLVIIVTVVIAGSLSFGLFFFKVTTDPVKLWSAPDSQARLEKNYFDENFEPFYRTEQILVKAKPFVKELNISIPSTLTNEYLIFGPVFNDSLLQEVSAILPFCHDPIPIPHSVMIPCQYPILS